MSESRPRCGEKMESQHKPGASSSMDEPISGAKPNEVVCPECGKSFHAKAQMERHRQTAHEREF